MFIRSAKGGLRRLVVIQRANFVFLHGDNAGFCNGKVVCCRYAFTNMLAMIRHRLEYFL